VKRRQTTHAASTAVALKIREHGVVDDPVVTLVKSGPLYVNILECTGKFEKPDTSSCVGG